MTMLDFPGRAHLIESIDAAVALGDHAAVAQALRGSLCRMMRENTVALPACVLDPVEGHYARRELYVSPKHGYVVIAMTWGPGQGTPIHDHSGLWCVEGVWHGQLEITQYDLSEQRGDRYRFTDVGSLIAGTGSAGSLIPPHEYHTIRNASDTDTAVSLHIYQRTMTCCGIFDAAGDGWHVYASKQLQLDHAA
ncbi:MAG: cysteine dioxygenase family protein [Lysobacter sp.]|nr:cysteine dioxygenase family protein [Lysobacter sp.]